MRHVTVEICGESLEFPVSMEAGQKLEAAGYDPLRTALRSKRLAAGEYPLTAQGVITVLAIGAKAAKSKLTREQIGQAVFDAGVMEYLADAVDYLAAFVTAEPEHPAPGGGDEKNDETA